MLYKVPRLHRGGILFVGMFARRDWRDRLSAAEGVQVYAIVESGGKQYRVEPGAILALERIPGEVGSQVALDRVLLVADGGAVKVGHPTLSGARVVSEILAQMRGVKIDVFKFKKRKKYRKKTGHRQELTRVRIAEIIA
jgi:large subunit ribosomal protein L21